MPASSITSTLFFSPVTTEPTKTKRKLLKMFGRFNGSVKTRPLVNCPHRNIRCFPGGYELFSEPQKTQTADVFQDRLLWFPVAALENATNCDLSATCDLGDVWVASACGLSRWATRNVKPSKTLLISTLSEYGPVVVIAPPRPPI